MYILYLASINKIDVFWFVFGLLYLVKRMRFYDSNGGWLFYNIVFYEIQHLYSCKIHKKWLMFRVVTVRKFSPWWGGGSFEVSLYSSLFFRFKYLVKHSAHFTFTFKLAAIRHQLLEFNSSNENKIQRRT